MSYKKKEKLPSNAKVLRLEKFIKNRPLIKVDDEYYVNEDNINDDNTVYRNRLLISVHSSYYTEEGIQKDIEDFIENKLRIYHPYYSLSGINCGTEGDYVILVLYVEFCEDNINIKNYKFYEREY